MGDEARVQALASSSIEVKAVGLEQPETGEGGPKRKEQVHTLNKREVAINYVCGAGKNKIEAHIDVRLATVVVVVNVWSQGLFFFLFILKCLFNHILHV